MAGHRVLIVDDQKEVARVLSASLETLHKELVIDTVPSGEEAILELGRGPIDLLIADFRLPGISGLELMNRFKKQNPAMKVMLVSGVTDPKIRQEVAQAGADAFFFKPIEVPDFLDAVERSLGMVETILPPEIQTQIDESKDQDTETTSMTDRISKLRTDLNALAVCLMGDHGQILAKAGTLPNRDIEESLIPQLGPVFSAGIRVSNFLGAKTPNDLLSFHGVEYDLFVSHVGEAYTLLVATKPQKAKETGKIAESIQAAAKDVLDKLTALGVSTESRETPLRKAPEPAPTKKPTEDLSDPELESVITQGALKKDEADAFWEAMAEQEIAAELPSGDSLSYDQALQLGLAPSED